jgi:hypothetical protein
MAPLLADTADIEASGLQNRRQMALTYDPNIPRPGRNRSRSWEAS